GARRRLLQFVFALLLLIILLKLYDSNIIIKKNYIYNTSLAIAGSLLLASALDRLLAPPRRPDPGSRAQVAVRWGVFAAAGLLLFDKFLYDISSLYNLSFNIYYNIIIHEFEGLLLLLLMVQLTATVAGPAVGVWRAPVAAALCALLTAGI